MYHEITSQDSLTLVTLSEAKMQCRLMDSFTLDDDFLNHLIEVCSDLAQTYCNRLMTEGVVTALIDSYQLSTTLWGGKVTEITSVTCTDSTGEELTITDFTFYGISQKLKIPSTYYDCTNFTIVYNCGFPSTPIKVKHGVLFMISTMYNNRDDYVTGLTVADLPMKSIELLNSVKHYIS